jgi:cytochrome c-type biogenesis protein CcmH
MLWFVMALMTVAAIFAVLWPLARRTPLRTGSDVAVYRDQIDEIERDRAAGLIAEREAEAARVEVSRRLLAAADAVAPELSPDRAGWRRRAAALTALILLPLGAASVYLMLGSPDLTGQPQAARRDSSPEPGGWPRLGGAWAGLHAARALRRGGDGAQECAAAARPHA